MTWELEPKTSEKLQKANKLHVGLKCRFTIASSYYLSELVCESRGTTSSHIYHPILTVNFQFSQSKSKVQKNKEHQLMFLRLWQIRIKHTGYKIQCQIFLGSNLEDTPQYNVTQRKQVIQDHIETTSNQSQWCPLVAWHYNNEVTHSAKRHVSCIVRICQISWIWSELVLSKKLSSGGILKSIQTQARGFTSMLKLRWVWMKSCWC